MPESLELGANHAARFGDAPLHGADRNRQQRRDLFVAMVAARREQERIAQLLRQRVHDLRDRPLELAIAQVVRALPKKLRDPFLLAASGDHRYEEIAVLIGIPVGTVKWRISEARRVIRMKLERLGHGDPR